VHESGGGRFATGYEPDIDTGQTPDDLEITLSQKVPGAAIIQSIPKLDEELGWLILICLQWPIRIHDVSRHALSGSISK
jgi:hypothetical protein